MNANDPASSRVDDVGPDPVTACLDCGAQRFVEHHDDDCPEDCSSDGCLFFEMNPIEDGRCERCTSGRAQERHYRHLCACRGADSESGKRYTDPQCRQAWLAARWLAAS